MGYIIFAALLFTSAFQSAWWCGLSINRSSGLWCGAGILAPGEPFFTRRPYIRHCLALSSSSVTKSVDRSVFSRLWWTDSQWWSSSARTACAVSWASFKRFLRISSKCRASAEDSTHVSNTLLSQSVLMWHVQVSGSVQIDVDAISSH